MLIPSKIHAYILQALACSTAEECHFPKGRAFTLTYTAKVLILKEGLVKC